MKSFVKSHPVLAYYILVFTISWGGTLLLIGGPGSIPGTYEQASRLFTPALFIMFAGPFLSGIILNFLYGGKAGLRELWSRLTHWRVGTRWYVVAGLTGPLLATTVLFGLAIFSRDYLPAIITADNKLFTVLFGLGWGLLGGGLLEETGWTGFVIPQLRKRHSIFSTGLIVGYLWGLWHFLIAFWSINYLGKDSPWVLFVAGFLAFYLLALPAYRILLVLVYDQTKSLLIIMLMHALFSAASIIFQPLTPGMVPLVWNIGMGAVLWIIIAVIVTKKRGLLTRNLDS